MRSRSSARASPTRGRRAASGGSSAGESTPTSSAPAPAANTSSVAWGAKLTIRRAGVDNSTVAPLASMAAAGAASTHTEPVAAHSQRIRLSSRRIALIAVAHAGEDIGTGRVVICHQLVVLVERVAEDREKGPLWRQRVFGVEVDHGIAAHAARVGRILVARR